MNAKDEIKQRYDGFAAGVCQDTGKINDLYTVIPPVMKYFRQRKIETSLRLGGFRKGATLLEVGSNIGQYTTLLAEKGFSMVGIDLSDKAVQVARAAAETLKFKNINYFAIDAEDLSFFKDETFDGVVSFSTLRYIPNLEKALKEIFRVTKRNGVVVVDFPNKHCPWFSSLKNKFGVENHIHDHFYSGKELVSLFGKIGFSGIDTKKIMFTHYTFNPKFLSLYKTIDLICEHTFLMKELAAIIVCKGVKI